MITLFQKKLTLTFILFLGTIHTQGAATCNPTPPPTLPLQYPPKECTFNDRTSGRPFYIITITSPALIAAVRDNLLPLNPTEQSHITILLTSCIKPQWAEIIANSIYSSQKK